MVTSRRHPEGTSESFRPSIESSDPESSIDASANEERKTPSASFIGGLLACVVLLIILILAYRHVTKKPNEAGALPHDPLQKNLEQKPQASGWAFLTNLMTTTYIPGDSGSQSSRPNSRCRAGWLPCADGMTCVHKENVCDGEPQCPDASDERDCIRLGCQRDMYACSVDGVTRCLKRTLVCDGVADCDDHEDESHCSEWDSTGDS
ncbi:hypothetical protein HPB50_021587 [Hyalomma asiaticum]|uniref:Uncharacterized protein n=1 Tax=Hyalomma asiaticum TaxID=266040 RepID=A0ACB7SSK1_HYAAI|nr:hypothetical protein HPB50_021587 [Hyalomma asiaticum]